MDQCKLKMTGQRLGQIFEQYNAADPQRPEIDHSLTEPLRREAGKQLHAIWVKFGGPLKVPHMKGNGAQSIIDALLLANPKWAGCAKSCVIQHANDRWAGKSPAKIADRGKGNRALTDEVMHPHQPHPATNATAKLYHDRCSHWSWSSIVQVEKAFHGVVHEMAAIGVPPSVEAMQDEIQSHLEGTIEGDRFKRGDRPSKGFIQSFVCRGIKERAITMDTCIDDADRRIEWRHFENFEAYFDQVSLNLSHSAVAACCELLL